MFGMAWQARSSLVSEHASIGVICTDDFSLSLLLRFSSISLF